MKLKEVLEAFVYLFLLRFIAVAVFVAFKWPFAFINASKVFNVTANTIVYYAFILFVHSYVGKRIGMVFHKKLLLVTGLVTVPYFLLASLLVSVWYANPLEFWIANGILFFVTYSRAKLTAVVKK